MRQGSSYPADFPLMNKIREQSTTIILTINNTVMILIINIINNINNNKINNNNINSVLGTVL